MSELVPILPGGVPISSFRTQNQFTDISCVLVSRDGRYVYTLEDSLNSPICVIDLWNETETLIYSLSRIPLVGDFSSLLIEHFTIIRPRVSSEEEAANYVLKLDFNSRSFTCSPLFEETELEERPLSWIAATEHADWFLGLVAFEHTSRLFWFNAEDWSYEAVDRPNQLPKLLYWDLHYNEGRLFMVEPRRSLFKVYDLRSHPPRSPTEQTKDPIHNFRFVSSQPYVENCMSHAGNYSILYRKEFSSIRVVNLDSGLVRAFWVPLFQSVLSSQQSIRDIKVRVEDDFLVLNTLSEAEDSSGRKYSQIVSCRFPFRKPELLFNLAWFKRPRDSSSWIPRFPSIFFNGNKCDHWRLELRLPTTPIEPQDAQTRRYWTEFFTTELTRNRGH